jgi:FAD/FMN-containing dehydrogenase
MSMALSRELYQAFEAIVGPENISDDPALLDSYRNYPANNSGHLGPWWDTWTPRGAAILLPGSTGEVQAIVRLCNKHRIKFKASSTFWSAMGYPSYDNVIQMDMRRMDRILEIDEKNMFAVIEPYVNGATLQAEALKRGLNTNIQGSGCSCSPVASATGHGGGGPSTIFAGSHPENMLGVEWVMPNGDLMRTGSLGSGLGWFCGEGPGPSLRSLFRGGSGVRGALGVFTKLAIKLIPWPGPNTLQVVGKPPAYQAALPDNFRAYALVFPTWKAWADCVYRIWDAEIGYIGHRQFSMFGRDLKWAMIKILTDPTKTLSDLEELLKDPEVQRVTEEMKRDTYIVLAGMTQRDIEWQESALSEVLAETGGRRLAAVMDDPAVRNWILLYLVRLGHKNLNFVYAGGYEGCFGLGGPPDFGTQYVEEAAAFKSEWEKKGTFIVEQGGDSMMGPMSGSGGGGSVVWECFTCFDPHDKESTEGTCRFFEATSSLGIKRGWGSGMERSQAVARGSDGRALPKEERERILSASSQPNVFHYQWKVKQVLDPNDLGDAYYQTLEPKK